MTYDQREKGEKDKKKEKVKKKRKKSREIKEAGYRAISSARSELTCIPGLGLTSKSALI